jgi:putative transcriptional regulator
MKFFAKITIALGAGLVFVVSMIDAAQAVDLSRPVTLVATDRLAGSVYEETVLIAGPLPRSGHAGFILNRPTRVKLETLFPGHAASRKVTAPVSVGGTMFPGSMFALTRKVPPDTGATVAFMAGVAAVFDGESIDRLIETAPNDARYFVGIVVRLPGELDQELRDGLWSLQPVKAEIVFRSNPAGLWKELSGGGRRIEARLAR